jgi:hypothetical protein
LLPDPKMQLIVLAPFDFADCHSSLDKSIPAIAFAIFHPPRVEEAGFPRFFSASAARHAPLTILGKAGMTRSRSAGTEPSLAPHAAGTEGGTPHREPLPAGAGDGLSLASPGWKACSWEGSAPAVLPVPPAFSGRRQVGESGQRRKALHHGELLAEPRSGWVLPQR